MGAGRVADSCRPGHCCYARRVPGRTALAVDLGGTTVRVAVVREDGELLVVERVATPSSEGPSVVLDVIANGVTPVYQRVAPLVAQMPS